MNYDTKILTITEKFADLYAALDGLPSMQTVIDGEYDRFLNHTKLPSIKMHDNYKAIYRAKKIKKALEAKK